MRAHNRAFETTPPSVTSCRRCDAPIITGLAEGVLARTDTTPLDPAAEIHARADGRLTFTLRRGGLIYRDPSRRTDPALAVPVVAEHACPGRTSR